MLRTNLKTNKGRLYLLSTTLQALQEIGLTKLPKLAKKTWADIASESNDEFETDLQIMIQNSKQSKTIVNPKGKQTLSQQKTPLPKPTNSYIYKNKFSTVLQMEPEFWDKNPLKATTKAFPPGFYFKPTATNKTKTRKQNRQKKENLKSKNTTITNIA